MNKSILITGSRGFIGQHCVKRFERSSTPDLVLLTRTLDPNEDNKQLTINLEDISSNVISYDIDVVIHLAGAAHLPNRKRKSDICLHRRVNTNATLDLARVLSQKGLKRFIFVSSILVNSSSTEIPLTEKSTPNPQTIFAQSKHEAEIGLTELSKEFGFELVIVRPPLVYGSNAPGNFGSLVKLASKTFILPFGLTNNIRSFISVGNLADFLFTCAHHPNAAGETFLVTDGTYVSTKKFTSAISEGLGKKLYQLPVPVSFMKFASKLLGKKKQAEQLLGNLQVDSSKAQSLLGWSPPETMQEAMKKLHI
jgi:nucleoside-diphosphate-sugar epimerase